MAGIGLGGGDSHACTRYSIKTGKFGAYFHDRNDGRSLTLSEVCSLLNVFAPQGGDLTDIYPECRRPHGEGVGYWCYECSLLAGIVAE